MNRRVKGLGVGVVALFMVASAAAAKPVMQPREVVEEYTGPGVISFNWPTGSGGGTVQANGIKFETRRNESRVSMTVADATGQPVGAYIRQSGKGQSDVFHRFCGSTDKPVRFAGGAPVWVYVVSCTDPGVPVSGEVVATFRR